MIMKDLFSGAATQFLSTFSYCARGSRTGSGVKFLGRSLRLLALQFCVALLITPASAEQDSICSLTILKARNSGFAESQNLVINSNAEWQGVWEKVFANTNEKPPLPEVDFSRRTLIAVFQGAQPSGGYEISIERIIETESSLEVVVKAFAPGERCVVTGGVTRPLDIIEIQKTEKAVVFRVKHRIRNCG